MKNVELCFWFSLIHNSSTNFTFWQEVTSSYLSKAHRKQAADAGHRLQRRIRCKCPPTQAMTPAPDRRPRLSSQSNEMTATRPAQNQSTNFENFEASCRSAGSQKHPGKVCESSCSELYHCSLLKTCSLLHTSPRSSPHVQTRAHRRSS